MNQIESGEEESAMAQLQKTVRVNRQAINRLKDRVANLERALDLVCGDRQMQWLYRNRSERMDANVPMFPELRAQFHLARYQFAARHVSGKQIADIACGTGYGCRVMVEQGGARQVTGIDICDEAIEYAREKHGLKQVEYRVADAGGTALPDQSLDCVISFETIEHVPDDHALIEEFHRILKPGGLLICSTPNSWPLDIAPHHVREYDRQAFVQLLKRRFRIEQLFNQNSGSDFRYNHGQPAGIAATTDENQATAECFIALARR
jgi:2-polyprenyl-3-methyl-5-hydroxy-6-metoxy-1,4-benzoquinol methylase